MFLCPKCKSECLSEHQSDGCVLVTCPRCSGREPPAAHAPPPWWFVLDDDGIDINCTDADGDEAYVAYVVADGPVGAEDVATARLIVASPKLLAAGREALRYPHDPRL